MNARRRICIPMAIGGLIMLSVRAVIGDMSSVDLLGTRGDMFLHNQEIQMKPITNQNGMIREGRDNRYVRRFPNHEIGMDVVCVGSGPASLAWIRDTV